jgi:endonuclease/exonuclease/phosphatase family metal-dependent hydrolase
MAKVVVASFNVENLFARPRAFDTVDWAANEPVLSAYRDFNALIQKPAYSPDDKRTMVELLVRLDIYYRNDKNAIRRRSTQTPKWAWLRANRGKFDRQPADAGKDMEIVANGRGDWIGWAELAVEAVDEAATRMTARVIADIDADVIAIVEAEDRPSLVRLNKELLGNRYEHVMLVDGNDDRGIDVGIMTKKGFDIASITSNVDLKNGSEPVFSRDCAQYEIRVPSGKLINLLVNHFKSQSGGGGEKRRLQAQTVHGIAAKLAASRKRVMVLGDLNEGPRTADAPATNLSPLFADPLVSCYDLPAFDTGGWPGTFDTCTLRNRFDYVLFSKNVKVTGGRLFRKGLWGSRRGHDDKWPIYDEVTDAAAQASDHAAIVVELDL